IVSEPMFWIVVFLPPVAPPPSVDAFERHPASTMTVRSDAATAKIVVVSQSLRMTMFLSARLVSENCIREIVDLSPQVLVRSLVRRRALLRFPGDSSRIRERPLEAYGLRRGRGERAPPGRGQRDNHLIMLEMRDLRESFRRGSRNVDSF